MESIPLLESNQFTTSINVNDENDESEYFAAANATPNFNYRERSRRAYLKQRKVIFYIIFHIVMSLLTVLLLIFFSAVLYANGKQSDSIHEQVHLSLTRDARSMMVTWVTFQDLKTDFPLVKYGRNGDNLDLTQTGYSTKFVDTQGTITRYIHRVNLTELSHQTKYYYEVGKDDSWSNGTFHFTTFPEGTDFGVKMCVYGDMSVDGKATLPALIRDVKNGRCQMLIHLGDISYQLQKNDGKVGDEFMREMEPAVAFVPFMVIPGNHEFNCFGFSHYENRFTMPVKHRISDADSYYSLTVGPINLFAVSSEVYGHLVVYGKDPIKRQAYQLENDLQLAEAIKADRPWKIGYQHRPLYCYEEYYDKECNNYENKMMRSGFEDIPGLEDLYQRYSMDLMLVGHEHAFEKLWPLFNRTVYKYLDPSIFLNPPATSYLLTGAGGCDCTHQISTKLGPFSVKRALEKSYTIVDVKNKTHMFIEQTNSENNSTIDSYWIIKQQNYDRHKNGSNERSEYVPIKRALEYPYLHTMGPYQETCVKKGMKLFNQTHNLIQVPQPYQNKAVKNKIIFIIQLAIFLLSNLIHT